MTTTSSRSASPPSPVGDRRSVPRRPFIVRVSDWTIYQLEITAVNEEQAIELAQQRSTAELWNEAEAIDGGQEGWEAFPAARAAKGGAP